MRFRLLHLVTHLASIAGVAWVITSGEYWWLLLSFLMYLYAGIIGVNVSLHRYFSHRSFETGRIRYWLLLVSSFFPMLGSPAAWGTIHLHHHAHSDREEDPHCPSRRGLMQTWFTAWPSVDVDLSTYRRFVQNPGVAFLNRYYFELVILYVVILFLIDWRLVPFLFALPAIGCFHGAAAIAIIPHVNFPLGYRNHETSDLSKNNVFAWIFSLGEGWHNNHHHAPRNYRHGEKPWELDPPAFVIKHVFMSSSAD